MEELFNQNEANFHPRTIIHIDIDCFYAQAEILKNPALKNKPVGVKQKNLMITCNYIARNMGVKKHMYINEALNYLPTLILIDGSDLAPYRNISNDITELLRKHSPLIERLGLDEHYVDVSELVEKNLNSNKNIIGEVFGTTEQQEQALSCDSCGCGCFQRLVEGTHIANLLRDEIFQQIGLTTCAGIAHNKLISKLVGSTHKPNQQTVIFPWQVNDLLLSLDSIKSIPGIGSAMSKDLNKMNIHSIKDLQEVPLSKLKLSIDEKAAINIKRLSFGEDSSEFKLFSLPKTIGTEDAVEKVTNLREVECRFSTLYDRLLKLLNEDGRTPTALKVTVRDKLRQVGKETKQVQLPFAVLCKKLNECYDQIKTKLMELTMNIFCKLINVQKSYCLTLLGVAFVKFSDNVNSLDNYFNDKRPSKKMKLTPIDEDQDSLASQSITSSSKQLNSSTESTCSSSKSIANHFIKSSNLYEDIDSEVFNALPEEIKNEFKIFKNISETKKTDSLKISNNIKQHKISDYFKHNESPSTSNKSEIIEKNIENKLLEKGYEIEVFKELPEFIQMEILNTL